MSVEVFFALPDDAPQGTVADLAGRLAAAGYPCREESDEWGRRLAFEGFATHLELTVEDDVPTFATLAFVSSEDPLELAEAVEQVFVEAGWDVGDDGS
jgi:hypothetical protein